MRARTLKEKREDLATPVQRDGGEWAKNMKLRADGDHLILDSNLGQLWTAQPCHELGSSCPLWTAPDPTACSKCELSDAHRNISEPKAPNDRSGLLCPPRRWKLQTPVQLGHGALHADSGRSRLRDKGLSERILGPTSGHQLRLKCAQVHDKLQVTLQLYWPLRWQSTNGERDRPLPTRKKKGNECKAKRPL